MCQAFGQRSFRAIIKLEKLKHGVKKKAYLISTPLLTNDKNKLIV